MEKVLFLFSVLFVAAFLTITTAAEVYRTKKPTIVETRADRRRKQ